MHDKRADSQVDPQRLALQIGVLLQHVACHLLQVFLDLRLGLVLAQTRQSRHIKRFHVDFVVFPDFELVTWFHGVSRLENELLREQSVIARIRIMHQCEGSKRAGFYHNYLFMCALQTIDDLFAQIDAKSNETLHELLRLSLCNGFDAQFFRLFPRFYITDTH